MQSPVYEPIRYLTARCDLLALSSRMVRPRCASVVRIGRTGDLQLFCGCLSKASDGKRGYAMQPWQPTWAALSVVAACADDSTAGSFGGLDAGFALHALCRSCQTMHECSHIEHRKVLSILAPYLFAQAQVDCSCVLPPLPQPCILQLLLSCNHSRWGFSQAPAYPVTSKEVSTE